MGSRNALGHWFGETKFDNGVIGSQLVNRMSMGLPRGTPHYVDTVIGKAGASGKDWTHPLLTVGEAKDHASPWDTIFVAAPTNTYQLNEAVVIPAALHDLAIIGVGNDPNGAVWTAPTTSEVSCLTINAYNVLVHNIKFRPPAYSATNLLPAGIKMAGAWQTHIANCLFQGKAGSYYGIHSDGNNANVTVENCNFCYLNYATTVYGTAIGGSGYTLGENSGWLIRNCRFHSNYNHVNMRMRQGLITGNFFADWGLGVAGTDAQTVIHLNIGGAASGCNVVTGNYLYGDYSTANSSYVSGTHDVWVSNISDDAAETEVTTGDQWTTAIPAS